VVSVVVVVTPSLPTVVSVVVVLVVVLPSASVVLVVTVLVLVLVLETWQAASIKTIIAASSRASSFLFMSFFIFISS
jgi:hypothetical protein